MLWLWSTLQCCVCSHGHSLAMIIPGNDQSLNDFNDACPIKGARSSVLGVGRYLGSYFLKVILNIVRCPLIWIRHKMSSPGRGAPSIKWYSGNIAGRCFTVSGRDIDSVLLRVPRLHVTPVLVVILALLLDNTLWHVMRLRVITNTVSSSVPVRGKSRWRESD